jgi:hypothetical protein
MQIVPVNFDTDPAAIAPTELSRKYLAINGDVASAAAFATISIKGKIFAITKDGVRKQLTKTDDDGEVVPVASISVSVLRANLKARVYYRDAYSEENSEGAKPTCFSHDGVAPSPDAIDKQANKCQLCPHAVWGSKTGDAETGKGTACSPNARLAVAAPDKPSEPMLLRVPPASIKAFRDAVKLGESRQLPYNQLVMRVGFDREAASPKLTFKPIGMLADGDYEKVASMYENEVVMQIIGHHAPQETPEPQEANELDASIAANRVVSDAASKAAAPNQGRPAAAEGLPMESIAQAVGESPEVAKAAEDESKRRAATKRAKTTASEPEQKPEAQQEAKPEDAGVSELLGDLDSLLGNMDD